MKYGQEVKGVAIERDVWSEQFAEPGDLEFNYMIKLNGETIDEDEDPHALALRLRGYADRFSKMANFLGGRK